MPNLSTLGVALGGYLFTYWNSKASKEREAQIDRVNAQVRSLYGPLLACVKTSESASAAMVRQHSPDGTRVGMVAAIRAHPEGPEGVAYRRWMTEVFQPLNERAADIVTKNADLLEGPSMEPLLLQLVAHVSAYRVILKRWEEGNIDEWSVVTYPDKLLAWAETEFSRIKERQARLLGIKNGDSGGTALSLPAISLTTLTSKL